MLNSGEFTPAPRNEFKQLLDNMEVGQKITLPSIGQHPKHYGEGYQELSFFITEQMVRLWHLLSSDSNRPIRRVLSGPMGVGKSYLALFLAAKAYAEGWLLLYVADANVLSSNNADMIAVVICKLFFALNKDILTTDDLDKMMFGDPTEHNVIRAAHNILHTLLQQRGTKTLLVIDEHGALFQQDPPVPAKHALLNPLMQLAAWRETSTGARVVLTGTSHARFENKYVKSDMRDWLEYVGPLSDTVFDKLLDMNPILSRPEIRDQVKEITNCVPRELIKMAQSVNTECAISEQHSDNNIDQFVNQFNRKRQEVFSRDAHTYFHRLQDVQRHSYRCALSAMFLPRNKGDLDYENKGFDYQFLDLGLVYRTKFGSRTEYSFLCPAAKDALRSLYKSMPLPDDTVTAITTGAATGEQFENALFAFLMKYPEVILDTTNLAGITKAPVMIRSDSVKILEHPLSRVSENVLVRCSKGYPRFDYINGRTFIQVSVSDFPTHNVESADIAKAFVPDVGSTHSYDGKNQIERYLDATFGGQHKAVIDPVTKKFVVTKKEVTSMGDEQVVEDFRIVYIHGKPGKPNHTGKVKDFPDVLHVSLEELQKKVFGI
ncbi:hypothetical protein BGZ65_002554 [Modicella reniformis]|uniref:Uncharacterized protein n=1 Tax=Modicella reniformis TaxID=1440133 RepID=A0A9P6J0Q6_9FUNG|nr:hypothetical protein BGZ65_002554 [Modicella reniformis]